MRAHVAPRLLMAACLALVAVAPGCGARQLQYVDQGVASVPRGEAAAPPPVEVLLFRDEYRLERDGTYTNTFRQRFRILDTNGVRGWGTLASYYAPWYTERPSVEATVTSPSGDTSQLDPSTIADNAAHPDVPDIYGDVRIVRAPLPNVVVGAIVDEVVVTHTSRPFFGTAYAHEVVVQGPVPREKVEVVIDAPSEIDVAYELLDASLSRSEQEHDGRRVVTFEGGPYAALEPAEPFRPADVPLFPTLAFATGGTWRSLARAFGAVVEERIAALGFSDTVNQTVAASDDASTKAAKLLAWMRQRVRYVGLEFGQSSVVPREPGETLKRGYGDCKDQATLLVALLRAAGVQARVALLRAGAPVDVRVALPALNVFDHAIVVVPGEPALWIDPTAHDTRAGQLPSDDWSRLALVVDDDTEGLVRTPMPAPDDNVYRETREVTFAPLGRGGVVERVTTTGEMERELRSKLDAPREDIDKGLETYVGEQYNARSVGVVEISDITDLTLPLRFDIEAREAGVAMTNLLTADAIVKGDVVFGWLPPALWRAEPRRSDFVLAYPHRAEVVYVLRPPPGYAAGELPAALDVAFGPGRFERSAKTRSDGAVEVRFGLSLPAGRLSPAEVTDLRKSYERVRAEPEQRVSLLHQSEAQRRAGRHAEALATARRVAQAEPRAAVPAMRVAVLLADLGFGTSARKWAAAAVALDPSDAHLQFTVGDIEGRDLFGRAYHEGWDRPASLAAFRAYAVEYPDNMRAQLQIGLLLEHDDHARRYTAGADLPGAVRHYDSLDPMAVSAHETPFSQNVLFALLWLERFEELESRIASLRADEVPAIVAVVTATARRGDSAGIAEAVRVAPEPSARAALLALAADTFFKLRRYPESAALTAAAAEVSGDAALGVTARVRARLRPVDPATLPADTPERATVRALVHAMALPDVAQKTRDYVAARAFGQDGRSTVGRFVAQLQAMLDDMDVSREAAADLWAASDATAEGDTDGYRVRLVSEFLPSQKVQFFVVKEASGFRLLAIDSAELGCEALRLQASGKTKAARRWLDWARELTSVATGQDPLRLSPFQELWVDGQGDVELAGAALCAESPLSERAVPVLEAARKQAVAERLNVIDHALMLGHGRDRPADALAAAERLEKALPTSFLARAHVIGGLVELGRHAEAKQRVTAELARKPDDPSLLRLLAAVEAGAGHPAEAQKIDEKILALGGASANVYNAVAWRSLVMGVVRDDDVDRAVQATRLAPSDSAALHTLACVLAERGRVAEARQALAKLLEMRPGGRPEDFDWYIVGRIAEQLDLPDEARSAYERVLRPSHVDPTDTYTLAQKRLAGLR